MALTKKEYARGYFQYAHAPQMLQREGFPGDQEPSGQAAHTDDDCPATTADMDPALQPVQVAAPSNAYDPSQHGRQTVLPRRGV
jgi:hypothetical protein